jgi:hypothetical protein
MDGTSRRHRPSHTFGLWTAAMVAAVVVSGCWFAETPRGDMLIRNGTQDQIKVTYQTSGPEAVIDVAELSPGESILSSVNFTSEGKCLRGKLVATVQGATIAELQNSGLGDLAGSSATSAPAPLRSLTPSVAQGSTRPVARNAPVVRLVAACSRALTSRPLAASFCFLRLAFPL